MRLQGRGRAWVGDPPGGLGPPLKLSWAFAWLGRGAPPVPQAMGEPGWTSMGFGWGPSLPGISAPLSLCLMFSV